MTDSPTDDRDAIVALLAHAIETRWRDEGLRNNSDPETDIETVLEALRGGGWTLVRIGACTHPREQRGHLMVKRCSCRTVRVNAEVDP